MRLLLDLITLIRALASDRARLALENAALRQQLNVLQRSVKRAKIEDSDRIFWVLMCRFFEKWKHDRRRIVHVNVTRHPTAAWTAQQITEAFPGGQEPRYLHRDRDSTYGDVFRKRIAAMGIREVVSAKHSPWQNPYVERVIGSIRRECTDHIVALGEGHLRNVLREYVAYYNAARCHQSLDGDAPEPRPVESGRGTVRAVPHLGGLHHRYTRAA